jgi:hypothetical protein
MPSYGGQLSEDQVWKLVAYVTSLSAHAGPQGATADESAGNDNRRGQSGSLERGSEDRKAGGEGGGDR